MSATETNTFAHEYKLRETREYANYVDGQWVKSATGKTFENRNPANQDDLIGIVPGVERGRSECRRRRGVEGVRDVAPHAGAEARRVSLSRRRHPQAPTRKRWRAR